MTKNSYFNENTLELEDLSAKWSAFGWNTVKINVYEKYVAGCVSALGNYVYFDNDGKIVEISATRTSNIPVVTGLNFDHFELYEPRRNGGHYIRRGG